MQALLILLLLCVMLVRVERDQGMVGQLPSLLGIKRRLSRSESTVALIAGALVLLYYTLFVVCIAAWLSGLVGLVGLH